jgi:hypothetical protein
MKRFIVTCVAVLALLAPIGVYAQTAPTVKMTVKWSIPDTPEGRRTKEVKVQQKVVGGTYTQVGRVAVPAGAVFPLQQKLEVSGLVLGKMYASQVQGVDENGQVGPLSNEVVCGIELYGLKLTVEGCDVAIVPPVAP